MPSFSPEVIRQATARHPLVADIDRNGTDDLVMVCDPEGPEKPSALSEICWFSGGGFEKQIIAEVNYRSCGMAIADINGDGWPDVVGMEDVDKTDENENSPLFVFFNPAGKAAVWRRVDIGRTSYAKDIEVGDLNGDRRPDVVVRTVNHQLHIFYQGDTLWDRKTMDTPPFDGLAIGDIDGDGDNDMVINGLWLESRKGKWISHDFDPAWYSQKTGPRGAWNDNNTRLRLGDINGDGKTDIVIALSENSGLPLTWYENSGKPTAKGGWRPHVISGEHHLHSLALADFDNDGRQDVLTGRLIFHTDTVESSHPVVIYYNRENGMNWTPWYLSRKGCYGATAGDLDNDGDQDVVVPRNYNMGPVTLYRNTLHDSKRLLDAWSYIQIDNNRGKWGDENRPEWLRYFGLDAGEAAVNGMRNLVSGRYFYRNPGGDMSGSWERTDLGMNVDAVMMTDVDGDSLADCIAEALPVIYWLEAADSACSRWIACKVGEVKRTGHVNGQGHCRSQIIPGGKPEILLSSGGGIVCLQIPDNPEQTPWPLHVIAPEAGAEGIGDGDLDGDGDMDLCAATEVDSVGKGICWWENQGTVLQPWKMHKVGETPGYADRFKVADINGDGRNDIVVTEERYPGLEPDAGLFWFENPGSTEPWERHLIVQQYSMNNLDCADLDLDGDVDLVTAEHKGPRQTQLFENDGKGNFTIHTIDLGKESHLGTKLFDMDGDGDPDLVSAGWDQYKFLHLWRNDGCNKVTITDGVQDEGQACFRIETPYATFFFQKESGGFSSILDRQGNDWIGFRHSRQPQGPALAASAYRGLPNLLNDCPYEGVGHPGARSVHSRQINDSTLYVISKNGRMEYTWTFTSTMAYMTLLVPGTRCPYWFLYEGTPGGRFDPFNQYWGTDRHGFRSDCPDLLAGSALQDHWNWIYFGNRCTRTVMALSQLIPDDKPDMMSYMGNTPKGRLSPDGMVVFGFGREGIMPRMSAPNVFMLSFLEPEGLPGENHNFLEKRISSMVRSLRDYHPVTKNP